MQYISMETLVPIERTPVWLPVLLEDEDRCTKLLIRCAGAVA